MASQTFKKCKRGPFKHEIKARGIQRGIGETCLMTDQTSKKPWMHLWDEADRRNHSTFCLLALYSIEPALPQDIVRYLVKCAHLLISSHQTVVVTGPKDSGKSTLVGHLLFQQGRWSQEEEETLPELAAAGGSNQFVFYMDRTKAERDRKLTINNKSQLVTTGTKQYVLTTTPGSPSFIKTTASCLGGMTLRLSLLTWH